MGYKVALVTKGTRTIQAHPLPGDRFFAQTCPHCGVGQIVPYPNKQCAYCKAVVTEASDE